MSLEIQEADKITFAHCKVYVSEVLNPSLEYKLCCRFDGAVELVENNKDYWIEDPRFNWSVKQQFNVLECEETYTEENWSDGEDPDESYPVISPLVSTTGFLVEQINLHEGGDSTETYVKDWRNDYTHLFIGNLSLLHKCEMKYYRYEFVECDFIEEIGQSELICTILTLKCALR